MRINTSSLIYQPRIDEFEQRSFHKNNYFFSPDLQSSPEFMYKNHLIDLKESEVNMLSVSLDEKEEEARLKREEMGSAMQLDNKGKPAAKDAKKDAKAPAKVPPKGAQAGVEDKNKPQDIDIEYPDIESNHNFIIME